jgi:hypothetical protein
MVGIERRLKRISEEWAKKVGEAGDVQNKLKWSHFETVMYTTQRIGGGNWSLVLQDNSRALENEGMGGGNVLSQSHDGPIKGERLADKFYSRHICFVTFITIPYIRIKNVYKPVS